jgi:hypothetical protein
MIQDEFSRLVFMYHEAGEGKGASVEQIFKKTLDFIEQLRQVLVAGDDEDKQAAHRMIAELYKCMQELTQTISKRSGVSEEQLLANSENPANFTPDQWRSMQESKERLANAGKGLAELLERDKGLKERVQAQTPESLMSKKPSSEKKEHKGKKPKKSDWMRS